MRSIKAAAAVLGAALLALLLVAGTSPALAAPTLTPPSLTLDNGWPGGSADGFRPPAGTPVDLDAYPATDPVGWSDYSSPPTYVRNYTAPTGETFHMYCVDMTLGYTEHYAPGTWDASGIQNLGYVARVLQDFFPNTDQPTAPGKTGGALRGFQVTVVQAAIWYFTNNFVVKTTDQYHDAVAAIVNQVLDEGPADEPSPDLTFMLSGPSGPVHAGTLAGPFRINASGAQYPYTISASGGQMFSDAAGKNAVADGATVPAGTKIWVRRDSPGTVTLTAQGSVEVPIGIYYAAIDEVNPDTRQPLITATPVGIPAEAETSVSFDAAPPESSSAASSSAAATTAAPSKGTSPIAETGTQVATLSLLALTAIVAGAFMVFVGGPRRHGAHRR